MIGKRAHGAVPSAGFRLGGEPTARSGLIAQASRAVRTIRKDVSC
jgi:hypothetical protein